MVGYVVYVRKPQPGASCEACNWQVWAECLTKGEADARLAQAIGLGNQAKVPMCDVS